MLKPNQPLGLVIFFKEAEVLQNEEYHSRTSRVIWNWLALSEIERQNYHQRALEEWGDQEIIDPNLQPYLDSAFSSETEPRQQLSSDAPLAVDYQYLDDLQACQHVNISQSIFNPIIQITNVPPPKGQMEIEACKPKKRVPIQSKNKLKKSMKGEPDSERSQSAVSSIANRQDNRSIQLMMQNLNLNASNYEERRMIL